MLNSIPQGTRFRTTAPSDLELSDIQHTSKHAVVGISSGVISGVIPGPPTLLEGQNSAGLAMSANFLPGFTEYQNKKSGASKYVSIFEFSSLALGQFASVKELKEMLPSNNVWLDENFGYGPTRPKNSNPRFTMSSLIAPEKALLINLSKI